MFCFGALRQAGGMAKGLCGCLFCMICGGPILLIVGIVVLVTPNSRGADVDEYNAAVDAYDISLADTWTPGTIASASTSVVTVPINIVGSDEDVEDASSRYVRAYLNSQPSPVSYAIAKIAAFARSPTYSQTRTQTGRCRYDSCVNGNGVTCPTNSNWNGPYRCSEGDCGTCTYTVYLTTYCVAVKDSGSLFVEDTSTTCFYNSDAVYSTTSPSSVEFQVRQKDDPYIALQRITEGSDDFGITRAQQTVSGVVLIVIGCVMITCICVLAFVVYKLIKKFIVRDDEDNVVADGGQQHYYNNGGGGGGGTQPIHGQPIEMHPSGGGGYGYGQPPPTTGGYGVPPPPPPPAYYNSGPGGYPSATYQNQPPPRQQEYPPGSTAPFQSQPPMSSYDPHQPQKV